MFIVVGLVIGGFMCITQPRADVRANLGLSRDFFYFILLPPIIFDGAYRMKQAALWQNIFRVLLFAIVGTILSTAFVFVPTYFLGTTGSFPPFPWQVSLTFAGLISATDPVATLAVFRAVGVNERLFALVFGEAVLNDVVAIVIYRIGSQLMSGPFDSTVVLDAFVSFIEAGIASVGIGLGVGLLTAIVFKYSGFIVHQHVLCSVFIPAIAIATFMAAESASCSGIIATLVCTLNIRSYAYYNLPRETQLLSLHFGHQLAICTETMVYLQIGFTVIGLTSWNAGFICLTTVWIFFGRVVNILCVSLAIKPFANEVKPPINWREQIAMIHAGLRGAIAMVLAITLPPISSLSPHNATELHEAIVTCTTMMVIWTIFFNGGTTAALLTMLGLQHQAPKQPFHCAACAACEITFSPIEHATIKLENKYIRPFLTHFSPVGSQPQIVTSRVNLPGSDEVRFHSSSAIPVPPVEEPQREPIEIASES